MAAITFYLLLLRIFTFIWFAFAGTSIFHSCVCVREKKKWAREKRDLFRCFGQMPSVRRQANHLHTTSSCSVTATETHSYWSMDVTAIPMYRTISIVESSNFVANRARAWKRCFRENSMKSLIVVDRVHKHPFFSSHLQFTLCLCAKCCCYCLPSLRPDPDCHTHQIIKRSSFCMFRFILDEHKIVWTIFVWACFENVAITDRRIAVEHSMNRHGLCDI